MLVTYLIDSLSQIAWRIVWHFVVASGIALTLLCETSKLQASQGLDLDMPIGKPIAIELVSAREVHGVLAADSDDDYLWINREEEGVYLSSGFPQSEIVGWRILGEKHEGDLPSTAKEAKSPTVTTVKSPAIPSVEEDTPYPQLTPAVNRVASLRIYASVANWDADAEADGLEVIVQPVDTLGNVVPVRGQLDFKLLGQRSPWDRIEPTRHGRRLLPRFDRLEDWSRRVHPNQVAADGVVYRLEFRNFHPDRDLSVSVESLLQARLGVAGQGVFEASSGSLFLRPFSPLRDDLQQHTGSRYFQQERFRQ